MKQTDTFPADLTVTILAGGLGTRLRSVVADRPKVMAEVAGRPFLAWWLDALEREGARYVVLCTGYLGEQICDYFGSSYGKLKLSYSKEPTPLGTGGALRHAIAKINSDKVLVLNGDSYCEVDLTAFWRDHMLSGAKAGMVLKKINDTRKFGRVTFGDNCRIESFEEKNGQNQPGWINAGVYLIARDLLRGRAASTLVSLERDLVPSWLSDGIHGFVSTGRFIDIGTPETYNAASGFFTSI